jgi:hypothetical protein
VDPLNQVMGEISPTDDFLMGYRRDFSVLDFQPTDDRNRLRTAWKSLAELTSSILTTTKINLEDTAHALEKATDAYAKSDADAAAEFNRECRENGELSPTY